MEVALGRFSNMPSNLDVISGVNSDIDLSIQENLISGLLVKISKGASPKHGLLSLFNKSPEIPSSNITKTFKKLTYYFRY